MSHRNVIDWDGSNLPAPLIRAVVSAFRRRRDFEGNSGADRASHNAGRRSLYRRGGNYRTGAGQQGITRTIHGAKPLPFVLIDGPSGSGKTQLTQALHVALRTAGLQVNTLSVESMYPGWEGLEAGSRTLVKLIEAAAGGHLKPRPYMTWEWTQNRWGNAELLDLTSPTLIEGCGAITKESHAHAALSIWVDAAAGEETRRARALRRDGETFAPWWDMWRKQDCHHYETHRPDLLADIHVRT